MPVSMCIRMMVWVSSLALTSACVSSSLVDVTPTNAVVDPGVLTTATGATQLYNQAISQWANSVGGFPAGNSGNAYAGYLAETGLYTDELMWAVSNAGFTISGVDERNDGSIPGISNLFFGELLYSYLATTRNGARQAREALVAYAPNTPPAWRARLQAAEAFAIVYTAEAFCSGIPLSTLSLKGEVVRTRGFTTEEMLTQALILFDSAATLAGDSTRFRYLAAIGRGRALLDLGRFADASTAVSIVPTDFVYVLEFNVATIPGSNAIGKRPQNIQVRDNEGGNGLVWSIDPRAAIVTTPTISGAMPVSGKYSVTTSGAIDATVANPNASVRGADGLEARLIEAEAALALNDPSWLAKLNVLRSTCVGTALCAPVPGLTATALLPLADPGSANARLDLMMKERALWLYLTGHRQGDLRRMAHVYHRDPMTLWPVGLYVNPGFPPQVPAPVDNGTASYVNTFVGFPKASQIALESPAYTGCNDLNP